MTVDEEILLENALSERRYILNIAREKIAALCSGDWESDVYYEYDEGYNEFRKEALAVIDELITDPNV